MDVSGFNWIEVALAALSAFVIGGLWYGPLFGKRWQQLNALSDERMAQANMKIIFGLAFCLNFFLAMMLSIFIEISMMMGSGALTGALFGGFIALIFVVPPFAVNYLFSRRSLVLFAIDAGYQLAQFIVMGAIMGAWS
jgi:hypothetical protein